MKNFKFILFIALSFASLTFISCSDSDNDKERAPFGYNPMKGEWQKQTDRTQRIVYNASFQIYEGTLNSEGEYVYNRICDRYWVDYTYYNTSDSVDGKAVITGTWDYTIENANTTHPVLKIRKQGEGEDWEAYNRINQ